MVLLCIDVGGTRIKYAVVEDALILTEKGSVPTPNDSFEHFIDTIYNIYLPHKDVVEGIAVTLPGAVNTEEGSCERCGAMKYPHDKQIRKALEEKCGCKVIVENDGKAATLAEYRYGALKGCNNAAVFLIGTGTAGGLIINQQLVRGSRYTAGEFSFINTEAGNYEDPAYMLGNRCSTAFLLRDYLRRSGRTEPIDGYEFFKLLSSDDDAKAALEQLCQNIAVQLHNLSWLLDPDKIAIGGGISSEPVLMETLRKKYEEVRRNSFTGKIRYYTQTELVPCRFLNDAGLIGAFIAYKELSLS